MVPQVRHSESNGDAADRDERAGDRTKARTVAGVGRCLLCGQIEGDKQGQTHVPIVLEDGIAKVDEANGIYLY